jgi:hypothetical protein
MVAKTINYRKKSKKHLTKKSKKHLTKKHLTKKSKKHLKKIKTKKIKTKKIKNFSGMGRSRKSPIRFGDDDVYDKLYGQNHANNNQPSGRRKTGEIKVIIRDREPWRYTQAPIKVQVQDPYTQAVNQETMRIFNQIYGPFSFPKTNQP